MDDANSVYTLFDDDRWDDEHPITLDDCTSDSQNTNSRDDANSVHTMFSNDDDEDTVGSDDCTGDDHNTTGRDGRLFTMGLDNEDAGTSAVPLEYRNKRAGGLWDDLPPTPAPERPLPPPPARRAQRAKRTQGEQEAPKNRDYLVTAVLNDISERVKEDPNIKSIPPNSAGEVEINPETRQLYPTMVENVLRALKTQTLSQGEKNDVFMSLCWKFLCSRCKKYKTAHNFPFCFERFLDEKFLSNDLQCASCKEAR